jgi:hypothetical protein
MRHELHNDNMKMVSSETLVVMYCIEEDWKE